MPAAVKHPYPPGTVVRGLVTRRLWVIASVEPGQQVYKAYLQAAGPRSMNRVPFVNAELVSLPDDDDQVPL